MNSVYILTTDQKERFVGLVQSGIVSAIQDPKSLKSDYQDYLMADRSEGWMTFVHYFLATHVRRCLLYTSPSPRDRQKSRMPSSA